MIHIPWVNFRLRVLKRTVSLPASIFLLMFLGNHLKITSQTESNSHLEKYIVADISVLVYKKTKARCDGMHHIHL